MIWATGFKGAKNIKTGVHHVDSPDTHSRIAYIDRVANGGKRTVEREVQIDLKAKTQLPQIRISLGVVAVAAKQ